MKKSFLAPLIVLFVTMFTFYSCHTYVWQPVKKQIVGKWVLSPATGDTSIDETWEFKSNGKLVIKIGSDTLGFRTNTEFLKEIDYKVESKITKHYIRTDDYWGTTAEGEKPDNKWLVISVNKDELFISSEQNTGDHKVKGSFQKGFVKAQY